MFYGKFVKEKEDLDTANEIIRQVFCDELGIGSEDDGVNFALSLIVMDEEEPVGAGRLVFDGSRFTIEDVAVLPERRGEGYGDFLVRLLLDKAVETGSYELRIEALDGTEEFFGKIGFEPEGTMYEKNGVRWQGMMITTDPAQVCQACGEPGEEEEDDIQK